MSKRQEWAEKIEALKREYMTAGPIHARDLLRQIHRMEKELKYYARPTTSGGDTH